MTKGELTVKHSKRVRRLRFWILQITGALDIEEDPNNVSFPNPKTCRELDKLKKGSRSLARKVQGMPFQESQGETNSKFQHWKKGVDALKRGLKATMDRLDQFSESSKEGSCTGSRKSTRLGRDQGWAGRMGGTSPTTAASLLWKWRKTERDGGAILDPHHGIDREGQQGRCWNWSHRPGQVSNWEIYCDSGITHLSSGREGILDSWKTPL